MPDQDFLYDDFFSPKDAPGSPATIEVRGRSIPIRLRVLNFGELRSFAQDNARVIIGADGKPQIEMIQDPERDGNTEMILASLREWPFKNPDGTMLEINEQHLHEMHGDVYTALLQKVTEFAQATVKATQDGINGPFVKASGAAS